ncbi:MAG: cytochrome c-type biogenesis CcmF C-terminal domain-containing protein, partial [Pseudomonadota bacterium]
MPTTEAAIDMGLARDVYISMGDPQPSGAITLHTWIKPLANWIWIGSIVMALGGCLSLSDRRFRVGAPVRRRTPAPLRQPAE